MGILDGKVAIVTGATSGIGAAIAAKFVAEGASVVLAGRRQDEGERRAAALGERAVFVRADVTVEAEVSALVDEAVRRFGRLDIMVNNAGTPGNMTPVVDFDADVFARTMAVHVGGVLLGTKHAGRQMAAQRSGTIINMASRVGKAAGYSGLDYSTAKAAVIHFTRTAAVDLGEYGVRVNSVSPDVVPTGIFGKGAGLDAAAADDTASKVREAITPLLAKSQPIAQAVTVDDVAEAVLWFAQDGSRLVTGQDLGIDGGSSAGRPMHVGRAERAVLRDAFA